MAAPPPPAPPALGVCIAHWELLQADVEAAVPRLFSRVVVGNTPAAFDALRATDEPIVLLIGGPGVHDVLKDLCAWRHAVTGQKRVAWVHSYYTGLDSFNLAPIADILDGVPISNARGAFSVMLAEHVLFATMYFNRQLCRLHANHDARRWERFGMKQNKGQRMTIVGYGDIGAEVGRMAIQGFGMHVTGVKSRPPATPTDAHGAVLVHGEEALKEALATADFVVAVLPLTPQTKHCLGLAQFRQMKKDAVFINIGRGATMVEADVAQAIAEGSIHGAALDVFEVEPLPTDSPLWALPKEKLLLSSHNADLSAHSYEDAGRQFLQWAEDFSLRGRLPEYLADPKRGY